MADEPVEPEVEEEDDDDRPVHRGPAWDLSVIRNAVFEIDSNQDVTDDESFDDETVTPDELD